MFGSEENMNLRFGHNKIGLGEMALAAGLEPATYGLTVRRSAY